MYYLFASVFIKTLDPYFRKYLVSTTLNPYDYFYIQTLISSFIVLLFFIYKFIHNKHDVFESFKSFRKIQRRDFLMLFCMSLLWIITTLTFYESEKNHTPFVNSIFVRCGTIISILLVGIFMYKEKYTMSQFFGIFLTMVGIYFVMKDSKSY